MTLLFSPPFDASLTNLTRRRFSQRILLQRETFTQCTGLFAHPATVVPRLLLRRYPEKLATFSQLTIAYDANALQACRPPARLAGWCVAVGLRLECAGRMRSGLTFFFFFGPSSPTTSRLLVTPFSFADNFFLLHFFRCICPHACFSSRRNPRGLVRLWAAKIRQAGPTSPER